MLRKNKKAILFSISLLSFISLTSEAQPLAQHIVVAPQCLMKNLNGNYKTLSSTHAFSLIAVSNEGIDQLIEAKSQSYATPCGGFMDVTQAWKEFNATNKFAATKAKSFLIEHTSEVKTAHRATKVNYGIKYEKQVSQLLNQLNPQDMWNDLTTLTSFQDRYANSDNGVKAAEWIKTQVETMANNNNRKDVTVYFVATGNSYKQPSVVAKIGNSSEAGIVVGGHMDTLSGSFSKKPGADDDGTGTVTVLETARTLLASGMGFKKPIYLIWYSAEEEGLVGSGYVVSDFKKKNIPVDAVIQFDMTGYAYKNDPTIWLINDYVNKDLTAYLEKLVNTYVKQPVKYTTCGYACSDHASWTKGGFTASMPFEAAFGTDNPSIHSSQDTMEKLSLNHMTDYAKLAAAFAVELAEPLA